MSQPPVDAGEALSRFLTQPKNHFAPTTGRLRYAAFLPNKALQTSVYRILGLTPDEVWSIGDVLVGAPLGKPIPARADIGAKAVFGLGLAVDPDGIPHPSHANIVGWPESRSARKLVAIKLAEAAVCVLRSSR
jgi:hypothetical protein